MAMKEAQRAVYRTMQGKEIDMHKLALQNEMTVAVGNAKVNARGDELGPGGKIIIKRDDSIAQPQVHIPNEINQPAPVVEEVVAPVDDNKKTSRPVFKPATLTTPAAPLDGEV